VVLRNFAEVLERYACAAAIGVDMPIGLPEGAAPGGRDCDREARRLLGPGRTSSVFSAPARAALGAATYEEALRANRASSSHCLGLSVQTWHLFPKIRGVYYSTTPDLQERVREVHPELCFQSLHGGRPLRHGKKTGEGAQLRRRLLTTAGFKGLARASEKFRRADVAEDDLLDACVACWTSERFLAGSAARVPTTPALDGKGLRMEIWY